MYRQKGNKSPSYFVFIENAAIMIAMYGHNLQILLNIAFAFTLPQDSVRADAIQHHHQKQADVLLIVVHFYYKLLLSKDMRWMSIVM